MNEQLKKSRVTTTISLVIVLLFSWLYMQWTHELGHIIVGSLTGAQVDRVILDPRSFSMTQFVSTPSPLATTWGGPILGVLIGAGIPLLLMRWLKDARSTLTFIAGFVLLANGLYIGLGAFLPVGDTKVMLDHDTPKLVMVMFGLCCVIPARILLISALKFRLAMSKPMLVLLLTLLFAMAAIGMVFFPA